MNGRRKPGLLSELFHRKRYRLMQVCFDLLALVTSWCLTAELRVWLNPVMALQFAPAELRRAAPPLSALLLLWTLVAVWLRLYQPRRGPFQTADSVRVVESGIVAGVLAVVVTFFWRGFGFPLSRSFVLLFVPVSLVTLSVARYAAWRLAVVLEAKWPARERVAMLGQGREVRQLIERLGGGWQSAFQVVGVILPERVSSRGLGNPVPVLGTTRQLAELINRERLQRILIVGDGLARREVEHCSRVSNRMGVVVSRAIGDAEPGARLELSDFSGLCLLEMKPLYFTRRQEAIKRAFDILVSGATLLLLLPAFGLFALLVKLTSEGPVFYKARRVGMGGRHFTFLKFRSMYNGSDRRKDLLKHNEKDGHLFKMREDPRVTPLGRFMRRYSIDELPQLINVLSGEMSIVGPRPLPADDLDPDGQSRRFGYWAEQRSRVLPGITGLWQISGRSDLTFEKMTELDIDYIQHWSLALDLRILIATPLVVLTGRGAY